MKMAETRFLNYKRVLIVDDEPDVLDSLVDLLPMCDTVKAATFEEAKELLETQYFDIAILDIMGVEGYKLLELANKKNVIAVMLTAHALSPDNVVKSVKEGAASYVPKDEMANITTYLEDILEAKEQGKNIWWRWMDRLGAYFDKKFGPGWLKDDDDILEKLSRYDV